ncbi:MAG: DUF1294 domain-containing protein [Pseudomonadaceae bacterium]|nr:MAG: DUF1294 domain-containing protein [Pseudomonadaceae bacterium]
MEQRGELLSWDDSKGFGFIQPENGGDRLFVHISAMRGDARPNQGDKVLYLAGKDDKGRLRATHMRSEGLSIDRPAIRRKPRAVSRIKPVKPARAATSRRRPENHIQHLWPKLLFWLVLCSLSMTGALLMYLRLGWIAPLAAYCVVSLVSFLLYRSDKRSALASGQRTPEKVLHLSELLGGWPGALIAQQRYRHKTRKASYQLTFWLIIVVHQLFWVDWLLLQGRYLGRWLGI